MKNLAIIQARMGATRLPGKVLLKVRGITLLEYEVERVRQSKKIHKIVVATTNQKPDDQIEKLCQRIGLDCFRGSEEDVLDRYYQCSLKYPDYDNIVRITGDCPLIDPEVVDQVIGLFEENDLDYASNIEEETYPDGMDVEVFKRTVLAEADAKAKLQSEREHVTQYIRKNTSYHKGNLAAEQDFSRFRLTVDNQEDFPVIEFIIKNSNPSDGFRKYITLLMDNPEVMKKNIHLIRNEGLKKSLKQDYQIKK